MARQVRQRRRDELRRSPGVAEMDGIFHVREGGHDEENTGQPP